jgi:hypothetical protein
MPGFPDRPAVPAARWSFGGGDAIGTRAGALLPEVLIAGPGQAVLHGSLSLSGASHRAAAVPRPPALSPGALARLVPAAKARAARDRAQAAMEAVRTLAASVTIIDDRGARYALTERGVSGEVLGTEMLVHLRVNPAPGPEAGWVELQGHDGTAARLFPSPRAIARTAQPRPAQVTAARWTAIAGAVLRADGPQLHRGIGVTLPEADGVSIHLDTLVSLPTGWHLYLHSSRPRARGRDGRRKKSLIAVHAEDDRGRRYLASYDRSTSSPGSEEPAGEPGMYQEELIARFIPRLDPLAWNLRLTFQGAHQEILVDLAIGPT